MKRALPVILLCIMLFFQSHAQLSNYERLRFGLHFSPNFSWVSPQSRFVNAEAAGFGMGYGLMAEFKFTENYFFSTGLSINQLTHFLSIDSNTYRTGNGQPIEFDFVNYQYNLQYLDVPLAIKMRTNLMGAIRFYGVFGLEMGVTLQRRAKIKNGQPIFDPDESFFVNSSEDEIINGVTFSDDVRPFRMGILMGAGIEYLVSGNTHIVSGIRFNNPFTEQFSGPQMTARVPHFALQLGVFF